MQKARSRRYLVENVTGADYTDDIELLTNTLTRAESQLLAPGNAVGGIDLYVNADKMECMCFNQEDISSPNGGSLKLVERFKYLGSSVSSTESDVYTSGEAWTAIDSLSILWESYQSDKIKWNFFKVVTRQCREKDWPQSSSKSK